MNTNLVKTYLAITLITISGLYVIHRADISYPLTITTTTKSTELAVVGEGKVDIVPDTAIVNAGITVNQAPDVETAQSEIDRVHNTIIDSMAQLGIDKENIQTSNYSVNPSYTYEGRTQTINGYNAQAQVTIKTHDISQVSEIISRSTAAGANQLNGVNFSIDDPASFREQARTMAIANAKEEAEKLAKELGISLGKVTNIVESGYGSPEPYFQTARAEIDVAYAESAPKIEPGSQTVSSTVTLYFDKR